MSDDWGVPTPGPVEYTATDGDFVTLREVKRFLDKLDDEDAVRDRLISDLIIEAEQGIRDECDRKFSIGVSQATRSVWVGADERVLRPDELVSIGSIVDADGNPIEYRVENMVDGFVTKVRLLIPNGYLGEVRIAGSWGWALIHPVLKRAAKATVFVWYQRDVAHIAKEFDANGASSSARSLPDAVIESLAPLSRRVGLS